MRRATSGAVALTVLLAGSLTPVAAQEGRPRCAGASVTIHFNDPGVNLTITGTSGVDVIQGGPAGENIFTGGGEDIVCAGGGDDIINGGEGSDLLRGQGGSDVFISSAPGLLADDTVVGGAGNSDAASYRESPVGVVVNQTTGVVLTTSGPTTGAISGIESIGGSRHDDVIVAKGSGVDVTWVRALGGNDVVAGLGAGANLDGGGGYDQLTYAASSAAVQVELDNSVAYTRGELDRFANFERFEGTAFDDRLIGDDDVNYLVGGGGDDVIKGKDGDDVLEGRGGDDVLYPGGDNDSVDGGANDPVTSTGEHGDLVSYQGDIVDIGSDGEFHAWLMTIRPFYPGPPGADGVGDDTFVGIESVRGVKGFYNSLNGDNGPNVLIGGDRGDLLEGNGGNDLLFGLAHNVDVLNGGNGDDYVDGGAPSNENDTDLVGGDDGDDTCTGTRPDFYSGCETIF